MIAQDVMDGLPRAIHDWFESQIGRLPYDYEDNDGEYEEWDEYVNSARWIHLEGGDDLWRRFHSAYDVSDVIGIYNNYFGGSSEAKKEEERRQLEEMLEKLKPHAEICNVVYAFAKESGICATPESSIWINKFLCDTLISD